MPAVTLRGSEVWWARLALADIVLVRTLSPVERARLDALARPADRARSLLAAALVRAVAGRLLDLPPGDVPVERTCPDCGRPHGRPRLDLPGAPQLSVSHSGLLVVVAAHDGPVGVDVQRIADVPAGTDAGTWVRDEAVVKAGLVAGAAQVLGLSPPLPGYASALALPMAYAGGRVAQHDAAALLTP